MHHDFWHNKWQKNEIGFHLPEANPLLVNYFPALQLAPRSRIFLPLCGKTLDIHWLLSQGFRVVGAELSTIAVEGLFEDLKLTPTLTKIGELTHYSADNIVIFNGDFFTLTAEILGKVDAVYDRAALVALPAEMRPLYTMHLSTITQYAPQLLVCFDYDQTLLDGPPFCVNAEEVRAHYAQAYHLQMLATVPLAGGLKERCPASEQVWLLNQAA
jgi:thiopurine S-methyltransferase